MWEADSPPKSIDTTAFQVLANALDDTPETVISVHLLRRGLARAYVIGDPTNPAAAIVQADELPSEPVGFGDDPAALWVLLRSIEGWTCVNVSETCALAMSALMERERGTHPRFVGDVYHTLSRPVASFSHDAVRLLTPDDQRLLAAAPAEVRGGGFGSVEALLGEGIAAGAIVDDNLVGIAFTYARTPRHADLGVATLEPWRGHGFATAAASLVCAALQRRGAIPVWSAGDHNTASLRIARRLGFGEVGRRTYVIPGPTRP